MTASHIPGRRTTLLTAILLALAGISCLGVGLLGARGFLGHGHVHAWMHGTAAASPEPALDHASQAHGVTLRDAAALMLRQYRLLVAGVEVLLGLGLLLLVLSAAQWRLWRRLGPARISAGAA